RTAATKRYNDRWLLGDLTVGRHQPPLLRGQLRRRPDPGAGLPSLAAPRPAPDRHALRRRRAAGAHAVSGRPAPSPLCAIRLIALARLGARSLLLLRFAAPPRFRLGSVRAAAGAGADRAGRPLRSRWRFVLRRPDRRP